jgi:hypothetical protein
MNPSIQLKKLTPVYLVVLACFALSPPVRAACPPPDGGCPGGNTAEGDFALFSLTEGTLNTAVGLQALFRNTTGFSNTAIGYQTLLDNVQGTFNTAVGIQSLQSNTSGSNNTAIGGALGSNTNGFDNTAVGFRAMLLNTQGAGNTAVGVSALRQNLTDNNTAVGHEALFANRNGTGNTAVGLSALHDNAESNNTAIGFQALFKNDSGTLNTASGGGALHENIFGSSNTATGTNALFNNFASFNTATGAAALQSNRGGKENTATGAGTLFTNAFGNDNTAVGINALFNSTGNNNIALGPEAGVNLTTGGSNIYIGNGGVASEFNKIRIGTAGTGARTQNATFIAGIRGVTVASGVGVIIGTDGQLGTVVSSARFKEAIKPMDKVSESILALEPVTFRYKHELDPDGIPQFGLIAEQVEEVNPDLVARDADGKVTVRYEAVNAMLLNEFLKEHRKNQEQEATIAQLQATTARQQKQIEVLTAGLRKVNDKIELSKPALQTVLNNR